MNRTWITVLAALAIVGLVAFGSGVTQAAPNGNWGWSGPSYGNVPNSSSVPAIEPAIMMGLMQAEFAAGADGLKLSTANLVAALSAGNTVEAIAAGQGVTIEDVLAKISSARKAYLAEQVGAKKLTQIQVDQIDLMRSAMGVRVLYMSAEAQYWGGAYGGVGGRSYGSQGGQGGWGYGRPGGWGYGSAGGSRGGPGGWGYDSCPWW